MPFTWTESEGELMVEITAPDERAVFAEGFEAMRELLQGEVAEGGVTRRVELAGRDLRPARVRAGHRRLVGTRRPGHRPRLRRERAPRRSELRQPGWPDRWVRARPR